MPQESVPATETVTSIPNGPWPDRDQFSGDASGTGLIYHGILKWSGLLVRNYHRVEVRGEAFPTDAPVLLVQNHNNGLCDAHFLMCVTRRPIRILVKYKLLKAPVIGWMLRQMDAVPMYRKKDGVDTRQNQKSFEAIDRALNEGSVIALFPEGESLDAIGVRALRSGVGRMAVSAVDAGRADLGLVVVPVGVTYEDRDRYRTRACALIGEPIDVAQTIDAVDATDVRARTQALMARIQGAIESLVLHADSPDEHAAAVALERIAPRDDVPLGLRRKLALERIRAARGAGNDTREESLRQLGEALGSARLDGDDLLLPRPGVGPLVRAALLDGPLLAVSWIAWGVPILTALTIARFRKSPDKVVTLRQLFAKAGFLLWIPLLLVGLTVTAGAVGLVAGVLLFAVAIPTFRDTVDRLIEARRVLARRTLLGPGGDPRLAEMILSLRQAYGYGPESEADRSPGS